MNLMLADVAYGVNHHVIFVSLRQIFAGLLRHHILGVPVGPAHVALTSSFLVLAMGGLRTPQRARKVVRRGESSLGAVDAPRKPSRALLQQPPVAVRVPERSQ